MVDLETVARQEPDGSAGNYLSMLPILTGLKMEDRAWLTGQVDKASTELAENPASYVAYGARGLVSLYLGSQPSPDMEMLQQGGEDLLYSIALAHRHMPDLANPEGGPLQVARIWDVQEAAYASGTLYNQAFFNQAPQSFPQFAQMLTSYWELHDLFIEIVDDPIIFSVAFSPDGTQIATLSESAPSYLRLWDAVTGEKLHEVELDLDGRVIATTSGNLAYSPDGRRVVAAYTNSVARVIDTQTGEVALELEHSQSIYSAAFSPDGRHIVTVDPEADTPVVWDVETGERVLTATVGNPVSTVTFSPDGRQIVGGGEQVQVWDAGTGELLTTLPGYGAGHRSAPAVSPDGKLLVMPGYPVRVYDLMAETELYTITTGAATVCFSPDGSRIATAGFDVAGVWDTQTGDLIFLAGHPGGADSAAFSPDGSLLVTGGPDGRFRVWDAETGAELSSGMAATLWWENAD
jgi:WD40 repeat protein